jgi:hypothetical protein
VCDAVAMRVDDEALDRVDEQGFAVVDGFLAAGELAAAQAGIATMFPTPDDYFADPAAHVRFVKHQFAGLRLYPSPSWDLNRLAFHPDLVDAARRYHARHSPGVPIEIYKGELWAKYSGAVDYDQPLHRDFGNHSLVVPKATGPRQLTTFIFLSDVTELDGPTRVVPLPHTRHIPMGEGAEHDWRFSLPEGSFGDVEVSACGPAGSLLLYRTDVFHRGSSFGGPGRFRFSMLVDFQPVGSRWMGKMAWPQHAPGRPWVELMERANPQERELFGFPAVGDPYWDAQTVTDVGRRYPNMDMTPYSGA